MIGPVTATPAAPVWRVGRAPDPWAWPPSEYAYQQRWDDAGRAFRTIYAGDTAVACYLEVLAHARPGLAGDPDYDGIVVDAADEAAYPTPAPGVVDPEWMNHRLLASAVLGGVYCDITQSATIATLRPALLAAALQAGFTDFDSAALKTAGSRGRQLTQATATYLYDRSSGGNADFDGIRFTSRHGDEHGLWAVFERPGSETVSPLITPTSTESIDPDSEDLQAVFALLHLTWLR